MTSQYDYQKEIDDLNAKIAKVRQKQAAFEALSPEERLADIFHEKLCRHNHADACGYHYESWEKPGRERDNELKRVNRVISLLVDYLLPHDHKKHVYKLAEQLVGALRYG